MSERQARPSRPGRAAPAQEERRPPAARLELGQLLRQQTRFIEAQHYFEEARQLSRGFDTGRWEAVAEGRLATLHSDLGNHQQAIDCGTRSEALRHQLGDTDGEACALAAIAVGWQGIGDHHTAIVDCRRAIALGRASLGSHEGTLARPLTRPRHLAARPRTRERGNRLLAGSRFYLRRPGTGRRRRLPAPPHPSGRPAACPPSCTQVDRPLMAPEEGIDSRGIRCGYALCSMVTIRMPCVAARGGTVIAH
ncbi:tetratricopeptide repeat protein [Streptomyces sp. NBC_01178]|uniref:tetratricopeptide repeat protein n=1 Tax=Streptomyces sp. NBC_01178 TaxID=2903762 RepID=UPI00386CBEE9